jgi:hypothetical protein
VGRAGVQALAQEKHVDPGLGSARPRDGLTVDGKPLVPQGAVEQGEGAAQLAAGGGLVEVGPEECARASRVWGWRVRAR